MPKLFYDIIPPAGYYERISKKSKSSGFRFGFGIIKTSIVKIVALLLIVCLNWTGLSAVYQTFSFFNNTENSSGNAFEAGVLDFELQSLTDFPSVCSDEPAERTISIVNYGNPFKYVASSAEFSGDVCDYVTLEANVDGGDPEYVGPLTGFNYGPLDFSDPDDWIFKATFNSDLPAGLLGKICTFKFVFDGSQTKNNLPFGQGFNDKEEIVSNITPKVCCYTEIRSCGYWKTHFNVYKSHLPQTLGGYPADEIINTVIKANKVLESACGSCGCGCDNSMRAKLKGQLLAMKFNIAHLGIGDYTPTSSTSTLNQIVAEADDLLRNPDTLDSDFEEMKDLLEYLNNLGQIPFCSETPPDECQLRLTKAASVGQVATGDTITYHLIFDNIGGKVCTGGGVRLKDMFGNYLQYLDYTSTRTPKSFNKSFDYLEWNFGNIYPDDPLIEIDLIMKVKGSAECNSTITNSANYWSEQTDWGEPVSASSQVVCQIETGVLINEFLPNPAGLDSSPMPNGEWVELYNNSGADVDVAGWWLYDNEQNSHELEIKDTELMTTDDVATTTEETLTTTETSTTTEIMETPIPDTEGPEGELSAPNGAGIGTGQITETAGISEEMSITTEEEGIIDKIDNAVDEVVSEIVEEILPDNTTTETTGTTETAEITEITEIAETTIIEQVPAIEQQPVIIPENVTSNTGNGGDGGSNGGDGGTGSSDGSDGGTVPVDSIQPPAGE